MRFSPGCSCCSSDTPYPSGCSTCPALPTTLYGTLTMSCGGYSAAVITLTYVGSFSGTGTASYIGELPTPCGSASAYSGVPCTTAVTHVLVDFQCFLGAPRVNVQFLCQGTGYGTATVGNLQSLTCPGDLSPVNVTVTLNIASSTAGACCQGATNPTGTLVITE